MTLDVTRQSIFFLAISTSLITAYQENSKYLGYENPEDRHLGKRRRPSTSQGSNPSSNPCNFGNGYRSPKNQGTGRTFFDFQYFNVEHNYNVDINCGGGGGGGGGSYPADPHPAPVTEFYPGENLGENKPLPGLGHYKPQKPHRPIHDRPIHGGHNRPGGGGFFQGLFGGGNNGNRPNKPFKPQNEINGPGQDQQPSVTGPFNGAFAGVLPSPFEVGSGLSEGIQGFIGTLPALGQSFQSILPDFSDFQWPQLPQLPQLPQFNRPGDQTGNTGPVLFGPLFQGGSGIPVPSNPFNGPPSFTTTSRPSFTTTFRPSVGTSPPFVTPSTPTSTTLDPDDVIYSDELKPVHEDYDPITDPYNSKPSGSNGRYRPNNYNSRSSYYNQNYRRPYYGNNGNRNYYGNSRSNSFSQGRPEGRSFSFPS